MSQRSVIEINHDFSYEIAAHRDVFVALLERALGSGSPENWKPLERFGIRRATQRHHSEECRVVVGSRSLKREYSL